MFPESIFKIAYLQALCEKRVVHGKPPAFKSDGTRSSELTDRQTITFVSISPFRPFSEFLVIGGRLLVFSMRKQGADPSS